MLSTGLFTFLLLLAMAAAGAALYFAFEARAAAAQLAADRGTLLRVDGELAALETVVRRLRGRVYADEQHGHRPRPPSPNPTGEELLDGTILADESGDDELQAMLRLQRAPSARPGG